MSQGGYAGLSVQTSDCGSADSIICVALMARAVVNLL